MGRLLAQLNFWTKIEVFAQCVQVPINTEKMVHLDVFFNAFRFIPSASQSIQMG